MTKNKRFTHQRTDDYNFSDILDDGKWIGICHVDCEDDFIDKLNELHEEKEQMKQRLSHAEKVNTGLIDENHRLRLTLIHSSDLNFDIKWLKENLKNW